MDSEYHFKLACMGQFYSYVQIYTDAPKPTNPAAMAFVAHGFHAKAGKGSVLGSVADLEKVS